MDNSIESAYQKLYRLTGGTQPRYIYVSADNEQYVSDQPYQLEVVVDPSLSPGRFYLTTNSDSPNKLVVDGRLRFNA